MLFSATQTNKVTDLARISLRPGPLQIDVDKEESTSTVSTLTQGYVVCPSDRRFLLLFTFLKKNMKKKIVVFFSSCNSVKYHGELLNYIDVPVLDLHVSAPDLCGLFPVLKCISQGKQKQQKRTTTFFEFCNAESGTLLCTDVAARGLDIPRVDWIVQYDPPDDPRDYIHRVGRTARAGKVGKSLLFLLESELGFLRYLKESKVPLNEYSFPVDKVANVQSQVTPPSNDLYHQSLTSISAREIITEKLLPASIGARWVQVISAIIRLLLAQEDIQRQRSGSCQGCKIFRICRSPTGQCQYRRWHRRYWAVRNEAEMGRRQGGRGERRGD